MDTSVGRITSRKKDMKCVIIDDTLKKILLHLNVKQLIRLERVSKQFEYCANCVLKQQKGLFIGYLSQLLLRDELIEHFIRGNITQAFLKSGCYDLIEMENRLKFI